MLDQFTFRGDFEITAVPAVTTIHAAVDVDKATTPSNLEGGFLCYRVPKYLGDFKGLIRPNQIPLIPPEETTVGVPSARGSVIIEKWPRVVVIRNCLDQFAFGSVGNTT